MASLPTLFLSARPPSSPPLSPSPTILPLCLNRQSRPFRCFSCFPISLPSAVCSKSFHRRPQATMTVISPDSGNALFCLMASCAALGQALEAKTNWGAKLSAPVIALLIGMVLAAAGFVPSTSASYDFISTSIMPMAVALCLLETDIQSIFTDAGPTLKAFWYGALATFLGTLVSFKIVGPRLGSDGWKIASSLCASYIGGTINYVATAQALGLTSSSTLAAGMAADNVAMAAYFAVIMAIRDNGDKPLPFAQGEALSDSSRQPTVETVSTSLAAAAVACTVGKALAGFLPSSFAGCGLAITALVTSAFSAVAAQVHKHVDKAGTQIFAGSQVLGAGLMLLYFSVVGASAGIEAAFFGGWPLLAFICILLCVHLGVILTLGAWSNLPMPVVLVASNANIGGPATAAAMASCRGWKNLVKPALLVGTLGYTIGTGVGCLVGLHCLQHFPRW